MNGRTDMLPERGNIQAGHKSTVFNGLDRHGR